MEPSTALLNLRLDDVFAGQIAHVEELAAEAARFRDPRYAIHPRLKERMESLGFDRLYTHQAEAFDAFSQGDDVIAVTGTSSGKTLCYNLPTLQTILSEPNARALYLFPTKALAQDQVGKLTELAPGADVRLATYDGDTPKSQRGNIRRAAHIVLTNPDMIHVGILPGHELWTKFLKSLRVIVIDEMHVYRGVFGSHVGNIVRRLLRLCEWHHNRPQIIGCSATIGNPTELFRKLTGRKGTLIDDDGAPKSKRTFVFWNPPLTDGVHRASSNVATSEIVATLTESGLRTLAFCRSRVLTELVLRSTRARLARAQVDVNVVESYRGGYTPKERRLIEQALFKGKLRALIATNAMELGVDVGGLDAVVMNGYPGTISSFWQQAGRAGRAGRPGLAIMVARDDPLEQFMLREPSRLLQATVESVALNPANPMILAPQLKCAAYERALAPNELGNFGPDALDVAEALDRSGELQFANGRFYYPSHEPPAGVVSIRSTGGQGVTLMVGPEMLGSMEYWRALSTAHAGAVYLHRGQSYLVDDLDLEQRVAHVHPKDVNYFTQPVGSSWVDPQVTLERGTMGIMPISLIGIKVTETVVGFKQLSLDGERVLAINDLDLPSHSFETIAVRIDFPSSPSWESPHEQVSDAVYTAALHGLEHALMACAPLMAGCDRGDLGSAWYTVFPDTLHPAVFIFDRTPGGVGLVEDLMSRANSWRMAALQLLKTCPCEDGCPGCLLSARCEANNEMLSKHGAIRLLGGL